jgi:hypothetical protein
MKRWRILPALVVVLLTGGACGGGDRQEAATEAPSPTEQATGTLTRSPTAQQGASVIWSQFGKAFDVPTAWFAVHVQNAGADPSVFTVNVQAVDAGGIIVGSNEYTTPTIAGHGSFDLFDQLGGNAFDTERHTVLVTAKVHQRLADNQYATISCGCPNGVTHHL